MNIPILGTSSYFSESALDQPLFPVFFRHNKTYGSANSQRNMDLVTLQKKAQEIFQCQNERAKLIQRGPNLLDYADECDRRRTQVDEAQRRHNDVIRELEAQVDAYRVRAESEMDKLRMQANSAQQEWTTRQQEFQNLEKTIVDKLKALGEGFACARDEIRQRVLEHIRAVNTHDDVDLSRLIRVAVRQPLLKRRLRNLINDLNVADFDFISTRNFSHSLRQIEQECTEYETGAEVIRQFVRKVEIEGKVTVDLVKTAEAAEQSLKHFLFTDQVPASYYVVQAFLEWIQMHKISTICMTPAWIAGLESMKATRAMGIEESMG